MDASPRQRSIESSSTASLEEVGSSSKINQLVKSNEDIITPSNTSLPENAETGQKKTGSSHIINLVDSDLNSVTDNLEFKVSDGIWCGSTGSGLKEDKTLNTSQSSPGYQEMRYQTPGPRTAYLQSVPETYKEAGPSANVHRPELKLDFAQQYPNTMIQPTFDEHFVNNVPRLMDSTWQDGYPPWNNVAMPHSFGPRPYPESLQPYPSSHIQDPISRPNVPAGVMYNRPNENMHMQQYSQNPYQFPPMPPIAYNPYLPDVYSSPLQNDRYPEYPTDMLPARPEQVFRFDINRQRALPEYRAHELFSRDGRGVKSTDKDYTPNIYDYSAEPPFLRKRSFEQVPFSLVEGKMPSPKREDFPKCADKGTGTTFEDMMMFGPPKLQKNQSRENAAQKCGSSAMKLSPFDEINTKPNYKPFVTSGKQVEKDPFGNRPPWRTTYPMKNGGCGGGVTRLDKMNPPDTMKTFSTMNQQLDHNKRLGVYPSPCTDSTARNFENRVKPMEPGPSGHPNNLMARPKFTNQGMDFHNSYRSQVCSDKSANKGYTQDGRLPVIPDKYLKDGKVDSATLNRIFGNESARRHFGYFLDDLNAAKKGGHRRCSELEKKAQYRR